MERVLRRTTLDTVGIAGSAICLVHCLAGPLLLLVAPLLPTLRVDDRLFHQVMLFVVVPVSGTALLIGCRAHRDLPTLFLGVLGMAMLVLAATALHATLGTSGERNLTVIASLLLGIAHVRNFSLCRTDRCDHSESEPA
jgi:hypothetical protein